MTMMKETIKRVVAQVLEWHPTDCIFTENAQQLIMDEILSQEFTNYDDLVDKIAIAIQRQEIYCPHEGIDRRSEFNEA